jgi:hypothetical protein
MTISITSLSADQAVGFKKIRQNGSLVYYSGRVILKGEYEYYKSEEVQEVMGDQVCFRPSKKDGKLIPRDKDDYRMPWFCFKNAQQAKDLFGMADLINNPKVCKISGVATVEVTNYVVDRAETETNDTANLVKIIKKSKPKAEFFSKSGHRCQ